jgi:hypothetical protein
MHFSDEHRSLAEVARKLGREMSVSSEALLRLLAADLPRIIVAGDGYLDRIKP